MPEIDHEFEEQTGTRRIRMKESRSRFLLESFKDVFLETLKLQIAQNVNTADPATFEQLADQSLLTARKVAEQMKQLDTVSTTVLTSPVVSVEVEAQMNKQGSTRLASSHEEPYPRKTQPKKPPASDR